MVVATAAKTPHGSRLVVVVAGRQLDGLWYRLLAGLMYLGFAAPTEPTTTPRR